MLLLQLETVPWPSGLGTGLQNQVQQFDSAWYLKTKGLTIRESFCFEYRLTPCLFVEVCAAGQRLGGREFARAAAFASIACRDDLLRFSLRLSLHSILSLTVVKQASLPGGNLNSAAISPSLKRP